MHCGITPCPCLVSHKLQELLGSRRIIPRYVARFSRVFLDRLCLAYPRSGSHRMTLQAVDFFQRVLALQEDNGERWSALGYVSLSSIPLSPPLTTLFPGHCYPMQDDLQKAYSAYQQALYLLPNPKIKFPRIQSPRFSPLIYSVLCMEGGEPLSHTFRVI